MELGVWALIAYTVSGTLCFGMLMGVCVYVVTKSPRALVATSLGEIVKVVAAWRKESLLSLLVSELAKHSGRGPRG
jgi:hypothetical protein